MERKLTIANAHSKNKSTQKIEIPLSGGSPWFGSVWLNGQMFTIYVNGKTGEVTAEKR